VYIDCKGGILVDNSSNQGNNKLPADDKIIEVQIEDSDNYNQRNSKNAIASSFKSYAEGYNTVASGIASHAEGTGTVASGEWSHAEGSSTRAVGSCSHSEGILTKAMGTGAHTEGYESNAVGVASHSEGIKTTATGYSAHSEGLSTTASGDFSHAEGKGTDTNWREGAHIMGTYGDANMTYSWHLANGTSATERGLAARIGRDGVGIFDSGVVTGNNGYAELFETLDGRPIEPGYFVTMRGRKVAVATSQDRYILGVTTAAPSILGNAAALRWKDKYLTDEWGRVRYQEVVIPALIDERGNVIIPEHKEKQPVLNPAWRSDQKYTPRSRRPEWVAVSLIGQVLVRDNGACRENGYCIVNDNGIAVPSQRGYRVLERTTPTQILIMLRSASFSMKGPQDRV
jgi:trimeric autotransporter adhesin